MRPILAVLLCLAPGLAAAAGMPAVVTVPCYPDNPLQLCAVPDVEVHAPGYLPRTVPTEVRLYPAADRFVVLVTPNIAPYEYAIRDAARAAARHCGAAGRGQVVARIDGQERYADESLESWRFAGRCE